MQETIGVISGIIAIAGVLLGFVNSVSIIELPKTLIEGYASIKWGIN